VTHVLPRKELIDHLQEQVRFLSRSTQAFDAGDRAEAKRMAATVRTLLHQTGTSHGLVWQLRSPEDTLMSCVGVTDPAKPAPLISSGPLLTIGFTERGVTYFPRTDAITSQPFITWWDEIVHVVRAIEFSRRDCVLLLANKGGGAHVDPAMSNLYRRVVVENELGWSTTTEVEDPMKIDPNNPLPEMMRAIAAEVLVTLSGIE